MAFIVKIEKVGKIKDDAGNEGNGLVCTINGKKFSMLWKTFQKNAAVFLDMMPDDAPKGWDSTATPDAKPEAKKAVVLPQPA